MRFLHEVYTNNEIKNEVECVNNKNEKLQTVTCANMNAKMKIVAREAVPVSEVHF